MDLNKINNTLGKFKTKKILVIGDIILDMYSWGAIERLNPEEEGSPLINVNNDTYILGGAANVAHNISTLGGNAILYGLVNESDESGEKIRDLCIKRGIKLNSYSDGRATTVKQRIMSKKRQVARIDREVNYKISQELSDKISQDLLEKIKSVDGIILSDYNKGLFIKDFGQKIINYAKKHHVPTYVDTKPRLVNSFKGADLITPNKSEAEQIVGFNIDATDAENPEGTTAQATKYFVDNLDTKIGLITLSEKGIAYYDKETGYANVPTFAKGVSDVTGAGDTVIATLSLGLVSGLNIHEAVKLSNIAASYAVSKVGTYAVKAEDLRK